MKKQPRSTCLNCSKQVPQASHYSQFCNRACYNEHRYWSNKPVKTVTVFYKYSSGYRKLKHNWRVIYTRDSKNREESKFKELEYAIGHIKQEDFSRTVSAEVKKREGKKWTTVLFGYEKELMLKALEEIENESKN